MDVCLGNELVESYVNGSCSQEEKQAVETHLKRCKNCRQRIESASSNMSASGQSNSDFARKNANHRVPEEICINQDEYPTKSMSDVSATPTDMRIFTKGFESMLGGYQILEELPRGGQAVVYKAIQKATKRTVAVKVLLQGLHASAHARYRFEREVDLAASLRHPNIVTIYDSGITQGQYYFAMEYIQGKALDQHVRSEKLSLRETMVIFSKVCSAVVYAHQHGVMHRDLKPGNILVDADGEPHILDFGLAKLIDASEQVTSETVVTSIPGKIIGTLAFMSPEQASGQPSAIDMRTDVYSLGAVLYKVLMNDFPYDVSGSTLTVLRNIQEAEPTRPSKIARHFNSEVEAILLKTLAKEPNRRYQSAAELQHDVECWLEGLPISAKSDNSVYLLRKLLVRHRYTSTVVGLLLVIVLSFSYVSFNLYLTAKKAQRESEAIVEQSVAKAAGSEVLRQQVLELQMTFSNFLQAWDAGEPEKIRNFMGFFDEGTREYEAMSFWSDLNPLTEKVNEFRQKLEKTDPCFAEFVIAEYYLRKGLRAEAIKAYQQCLSYARSDHLKKEDQWIATQAKSKLYELTYENQQDGTSSRIRD